MSLDGAYDDGNIFAKILRGEAPCVKVYEDADVLAFMDVFPQAPGHVLVIPKTSRARNLLEAEPAVVGTLFQATQRLAKAVRAALKPDGLTIIQYNGSEAGQTVYHLHVHIIPRREGEPLGRHGERMADVEELKALASRIAAEIG
jgi:histidine triad (HIT) family protein